MKRRAFIVTAGAAVATRRMAWTQAARLPRVALVARQTITDMAEDGNARWSAFLGELRSREYIEGETIAFDRWSEIGLSNEQRAQLALQIVTTDPDVVLASGSPGIHNFGAATAAIPIVAIGTFPPEFHADLGRPGGNLTGFDISGGGAVYGKAVQLLRDAIPTVVRIAYLASNRNWDDVAVGGKAREAAEALNLRLMPALMNAPIDDVAIRAAFSSITRDRFDAIFVPSNGGVRRNRKLLADLINQAELPSITTSGELTEAGLLMSINANLPDLFRRAASYVDRILKGEPPGSLPIQQPEKFDLVINLRTARALGIEIPPKLLIQATELIE